MQVNNTKRVKTQQKNVFQDAVNNQKQQQELGNKDQKIEKTTFKKVSINNFNETKKWMVTKSDFVKKTKKSPKARLTQKM